MKKLFTIMMALALVVGLSASAYAAYGVQLTLTAPSIAKSGCEKAGAVTFSFANGTVLTAGDWWYFDLDQGATLCKKIDYFIVGGTVAPVAGSLVTITNETAQLATAAGSFLTLTANGNNLAGPLKVSVAPVAATLGGAGTVLLRVKGDSGSRRVYVYVYGTAATDNLTMAVPAGGSITLSIFNGFAYDGTTAGNGGVAPANAARYLVRADKTALQYSTAIPETGETAVPYVQNTLCVNAESFTGNDIYISLNSKNDFLTFSGDSKIAHVAAEFLTLALCKATGNSFPISTQGACGFDIDANGSLVTSICGAADNRITLKTTSPFSGGESYDIVLQSNTTGVYFSGPAAVTGIKSTEDVCSSPGTPVVSTTKNSNASGTEDVAFPSSTCSIADTSKVNKIWTTGGAINTLGAYNALWFNMASLVYDTSIISAGTEVKLTATLSKVPCGGAVTETFTLGSFVTTCPTSDGSGATLVYPFLPPMQGLGSWWGGFTITNMTAADGDVTFTFMEYDGDKATYKVTVKAGQTFTGLSDATLLGLVTPDAANTGTFGDSNITVKAVAAFADAAGMTFTGNGTEGVGYTAYK